MEVVLTTLDKALARGSKHFSNHLYVEGIGITNGCKISREVL